MKAILGALVAAAIIGAAIFTAKEKGLLEVSYDWDAGSASLRGVGALESDPSKRIHSKWVDPTPDAFTADEIPGEYRNGEHEFRIAAMGGNDLELWIGPGYGRQSRTVQLTYNDRHGVWTCTEYSFPISITRKVNFDGTSKVFVGEHAGLKLICSSK